MEGKLAQLAATASQKDKQAGLSQLLQTTLAQPDPTKDTVTLVQTVVTDERVGLVVARQVITELVSSIAGAVKGSEIRKKIIQETLQVLQPRLVSFEEQVAGLRYQLADIFEEEEDWSEAARVLMGVSLESGHRLIADEDKLRVYIRIVRLLLEEEDSIQAETYYNRAALLIHSTQDRELQLSFKLSQARIMDYSRKFLEAALRYHELSWIGEIDEDERTQALSAAVTCAVLAPAGPNRSRVLASLCRDERTAQLPSHTILTKMFLDRILRPAEIQGFEASLKPHQLAKIAQSSNDRLAAAAAANEEAEPGASKRTGPSTVLDRAVMEHNLLACSKIYNNITFSGLGSLLDLAPSAAETMARKMIEQGRLRGWIDQVDRLIWFEEEEHEAQGKAGGLGDVDQHTEDTGAPLTKQWDNQIRMTSASVESIVQQIIQKGLIPNVPVTA
ncbi:hypothetical protein AURDEDRAFT_133335 [Auricularia subglabra TFB-10046 SS5]|nr:hypothetical protein AURDEDRAFT_133335 [Auricularia subglabra TFB-10046 SS5]